ncbi:uncharacterized protein H6S33_003539 [Morchella sextelata]|uniref:uncharacterized protein n=1 Tax=Morchella sextelata TaxID=1174677 RepID=UPI001D045A89|nr:uncharacterized protein H6S33_003539 [Morchella sextelata]KAH0606705.1 hypothetical protein H6S33_003539 [Morchella sextelata]
MVLVIIGTIVALAWMCYRASTLLKIPIPTLVKLLGLDLPAPPRVSLHGIAADTITLHWSLPEKAGSVAKHIIQINGINVGESEKRGETSVTVTGLNPDNLYNVRVIAANAHNFQAPGQLIRLRTRRKSLSSSSAESSVGPKTDSSEDLPSIHSHHVEPQQQHPQPQHAHHHRRAGKGSADQRRNSPAAAAEQQAQQGQGAAVAAAAAEEQHSVETLTAALEAVRRDTDDVDSQLAHTEEEFKSAEAVLRSELDLLKEKKNEEDLSRQKLRSETRSLEEVKRAAEALRSKTDKALRAKEEEIRRMRDDSARWDEERAAAVEKVGAVEKEAEEARKNALKRETELGEEMKVLQKNIVEMEEEIRSLIGAIKAAEARREQWKVEDEKESVRIAEDEREEREWKVRQRKLETRYVNVYNSYQAAEIDYMRSKEHLLSSESRRGSQSDTVPQKKTKQRRHRNRKSRTHTLSGSTNSFPSQDQIFSDTQSVNSLHLQRPMGNAFSTALMPSPFFNIANGAAPTDQGDDPMSASMELERITGGAPMSPTANSLLPSNLFSFEDSPPSPKGSSPHLEDRNPNLDGLGLTTTASPQSSGSASTRLSSPGSSFNHIPLFPHLPETPSTNPPESVSGGRRFVKLFSNSFNRQRGKTIPLEGPLLGTLTNAESRSVPKSHDHPPGLDPIGTRRRSGSHGSTWDFARFKKGPPGPAPGLERTNSEHSGRRTAFNPFNPSFDPIEPARLFDSRPSSIASFDINTTLPIPGSDVPAAFGWPAAAIAAHENVPRNRSSLLASWTEYPPASSSRPISPASTSGHSWFSPAAAAAAAVPVAPRLNPAAPTFEARHHGPDAARSKDSLRSVGTDASEGAAKDSSLLGRLGALSRKGSTGKFNLPNWKKEGGFFGRGKKEGDDEGVGEAAEVGFAGSGSPLPWGGKGAGFFGRREEERGGEREREGFFGAVGGGKGGEKGLFGRKKGRGGVESEVEGEAA